MCKKDGGFEKLGVIGRSVKEDVNWTVNEDVSLV